MDWKRRTYASPRLGIAIIPARTMRASVRSVRTRSTMARMFRRVSSGSAPRSMSLAPVSSTSTSKGWRSSQSSRRSAPAELSPLTPALTTRWGRPASRIFCSISAG